MFEDILFFPVLLTTLHFFIVTVVKFFCVKGLTKGFKWFVCIDYHIDKIVKEKIAHHDFTQPETLMCEMGKLGIPIFFVFLRQLFHLPKRIIDS
jgi:hypothetical protein